MKSKRLIYFITEFGTSYSKIIQDLKLSEFTKEEIQDLIDNADKLCDNLFDLRGILLDEWKCRLDKEKKEIRDKKIYMEESEMNLEELKGFVKTLYQIFTGGKQ